MSLRSLFLAATLLAGASLAQALELKPYSAAALAEALAAGKPVALHFRADWCPTCRVQDKALQSLADEKGLDLAVLKVDYDNEKDLKRQYKVTTQSTLVVLRGAKETARLAGDTSKLNIMNALKTAL